MISNEPDTSKLREYVLSLDKQRREEYARRCKTTLGHLNQIMYGNRQCHPVLAIELDKQSGGQVTFVDLCPNADWNYVRARRFHQSHAAQTLRAS